ncbi:hypothetical protein H8E77_29800 [bacterium]|nr:hypothetical protein [bacterium]
MRKVSSISEKEDACWFWSVTKLRLHYLKLWWNPKQDVDSLLKEWYERCVGSEAGGLFSFRPNV